MQIKSILLVVIAISGIAASITIMGIQTSMAKALPDQAAGTGSKPNNCGGSNEVKLAFPPFGTDTGKLTGEFNSAANDHDDPSTHENWPPIPSECRNN